MIKIILKMLTVVAIVYGILRYGIEVRDRPIVPEVSGYWVSNE